MSMRSINRILASVNTKIPVVAIQSYSKIAPGVFKVVASIDKEECSKEALENGFEKLFSGAFSVIPETIFKVDDDYYNIYRTIVVANQENHEYSDDNIKSLGLTLTTANLFIDKSQLVWQVIGDGENKRIVLTSVDDYDKILAGKKSKQIVTASSIKEDVEFNFGDYVMFYNPMKRKVEAGYALDNKKVFTHNNELLEVDSASVLEAVVASSIASKHKHLALPINKLQFLEEASDKDTAAGFLDYWRKLYANTPVYDELQKLIYQNAM